MQTTQPITLYLKVSVQAELLLWAFFITWGIALVIQVILRVEWTSVPRAQLLRWIMFLAGSDVGVGVFMSAWVPVRHTGVPFTGIFVFIYRSHVYTLWGRVYSICGVSKHDGSRTALYTFFSLVVPVMMKIIGSILHNPSTRQTRLKRSVNPLWSEPHT